MRKTFQLSKEFPVELLLMDEDFNNMKISTRLHEMVNVSIKYKLSNTAHDYMCASQMRGNSFTTFNNIQINSVMTITLESSLTDELIRFDIALS